MVDKSAYIADYCFWENGKRLKDLFDKYNDIDLFANKFEIFRSAIESKNYTALILMLNYVKKYDANYKSKLTDMIEYFESEDIEYIEFVGQLIHIYIEFISC